MIALALAVALALPAKLAPIDQCGGDDSFALFRDTLASAANREDAEALEALVAPNLRDTQSVADDWQRLRKLLRMGCVRSGEARVMPSASRQLEFLPAESIKAKYLALPGADLLASTEDPNSVVEGEVLKWNLVTATNLAGHTWTGVELADGRTGFILDSELYSLEFPFSIRIEKRDGQWMITRFD
jgi:hypothetical protein